MSKDHWEAILASAPLNATAGTVTSKGYQYEPDKRITAPEWDSPPQMRKPTGLERAAQGFVDHTGKRLGRLTVLGIAAGVKANDKGLSWICRCACGKYVSRRQKAIARACEDNRCQACQHTVYLARAASGNNARIRAESEKARKW